MIGDVVKAYLCEHSDKQSVMARAGVNGKIKRSIYVNIWISERVMTGYAVKEKQTKPAEVATVDAPSTQRRLPVKTKNIRATPPPPYGRRLLIMRTRSNDAVARVSSTCVWRFKIEPTHGRSVTYRIGQRFRETRAHGRQTGPSVLDSVGEPDEVVHAQQGTVLSQRSARRGVPFIRGHGGGSVLRGLRYSNKTNVRYTWHGLTYRLLRENMLFRTKCGVQTLALGEIPGFWDHRGF